MIDYEKLYHSMVIAADDAATALEHGWTQQAKEILLQALLEAENMYIESE